MDKQIQQLIRTNIVEVSTPITVRHTPLLIHDERLTGIKSQIYGDAGSLSGRVGSLLIGCADGKRGVVSEKLSGDWGDITGDISGIWGNTLGVSGDATGKSGDVSKIFGNFSNWRGNMSGISGYVSGYGGDATGIIATMDEIKEALKGGF